MTYDEWKEEHAKAKVEIIKRNNLTIPTEISKYFEYDNMVKNETSFCPLFKDNIKCHDIDNLNCYYCGCPYFKVNDNPKVVGKTTVASICIIDSKFKKLFYENPDINNVVKIHCDCSDCYIPHSSKFAEKMLLESEHDNCNIGDHVSILEYMRKKQMKWINDK